MTCAYLGGALGSWTGALVYSHLRWPGVCALLGVLAATALGRHLVAIRSMQADNELRAQAHCRLSVGHQTGGPPGGHGHQTPHATVDAKVHGLSRVHRLPLLDYELVVRDDSAEIVKSQELDTDGYQPLIGECHHRPGHHHHPVM